LILIVTSCASGYLSIAMGSSNGLAASPKGEEEETAGGGYKYFK
jgi:hypothetical protein